MNIISILYAIKFHIPLLINETYVLETNVRIEKITTKQVLAQFLCKTKDEFHLTMQCAKDGTALLKINE